MDCFGMKQEREEMWNLGVELDYILLKDLAEGLDQQTDYKHSALQKNRVNDKTKMKPTNLQPNEHSEQHIMNWEFFLHIRQRVTEGALKKPKINNGKTKKKQPAFYKNVH